MIERIMRKSYYRCPFADSPSGAGFLSTNSLQHPVLRIALDFGDRSFTRVNASSSTDLNTASATRAARSPFAVEPVRSVAWSSARFPIRWFLKVHASMFGNWSWADRDLVNALRRNRASSWTTVIRAFGFTDDAPSEKLFDLNRFTTKRQRASRTQIRILLATWRCNGCYKFGFPRSAFRQIYNNRRARRPCFLCFDIPRSGTWFLCRRDCRSTNHSRPTCSSSGYSSVLYTRMIFEGGINYPPIVSEMKSEKRLN